MGDSYTYGPYGYASWDPLGHVTIYSYDNIYIYIYIILIWLVLQHVGFGVCRTPHRCCRSLILGRLNLNAPGELWRRSTAEVWAQGMRRAGSGALRETKRRRLT